MRVFLFILVLVFTISAQDNFSEATRLASKGEYTKALESYRAAQKDAKTPEAAAQVHYNIGVCLYQLERPVEALPELNEAINLRGGKYQRAWYALGMAEATLDHPAEAKMAFTRAVELDKKDAEAWFDLGLVLIAQKDFPAARAAFENAVEFKSVSTADAHNNIGVILALNGEVAAAIRKFEISGSTEAISTLKYCREHSADMAKNVVGMLEFANMRKPAGP
jgi:tetratricopeptide (TPR) repeat protein